MGLDISVYKIVKNPKNEDSYYFRLIDDDGNYNRRNFPEWTKEFEQEVTEDWFDWEKFKEETGIDINNCDWHGESYGPEGSFMKVSPKGVELPKWDESIYKDYDEFKAEEDKIMIRIDLDKVPTYKKTIKVLYHEEVGYQRKGLNDKFYDDYQDGKIGYFVWSLAELQRYKDEYCDEPYEYQYHNGEMSGKIVKPKENFQHNIIDHFTEGEDVVTFDW